ncbi:hypothetical protein PP178_12235 [Zeaxanthinibacter sp. PT1]|uniref:hypothetical protein n=1 Tax=Zeaxanthinibacter TaxID=561554 RepID=UPI00234B7D97|nr:hypothetical protein [Zeaxanthinibacter sp. PT1]MDC6352323.1 hypothetical protein [Zeaxanthinibacter sp. PT1]
MDTYKGSPQDLQSWVSGTNVSKANRLQKAGRVLNAPELVAPLFKLAFGPEMALSYKALLILEQVAIKKPIYILQSYHESLDKLHTITEHRSVRPLARITELMLLQSFQKKDPLFLDWFGDEDLKKMTSLCFNWLIGQHKPATKAFAIHCLYLLGTRISWIHPELKAVIENKYADESPAFRARARHILPRLS